jgi:hypothetical protein
VTAQTPREQWSEVKAAETEPGSGLGRSVGSVGSIGSTGSVGWVGWVGRVGPHRALRCRQAEGLRRALHVHSCSAHAGRHVENSAGRVSALRLATANKPTSPKLRAHMIKSGSNRINLSTADLWQDAHVDAKHRRLKRTHSPPKWATMDALAQNTYSTKVTQGAREPQGMHVHTVASRGRAADQCTSES